MNASQVFALMLFSGLCGGALGHLYRLAVRVPAWLFQD